MSTKQARVSLDDYVSSAEEVDRYDSYYIVIPDDLVEQDEPDDDVEPDADDELFDDELFDDELFDEDDEDDDEDDDFFEPPVTREPRTSASAAGSAGCPRPWSRAWCRRWWWTCRRRWRPAWRRASSAG
nr:hypothetical protein GCM10017745_41210 [Saccharothrix mutabilis subsp. capreolus]